jgi:hypothetical protein
MEPGLIATILLCWHANTKVLEPNQPSHRGLAQDSGKCGRIGPPRRFDHNHIGLIFANHVPKLAGPGQLAGTA